MIVGCHSAVSSQSKENFNDYQCFAFILCSLPGQLKPDCLKILFKILRTFKTYSPIKDLTKKVPSIPSHFQTIMPEMFNFYVKSQKCRLFLDLISLMDRLEPDPALTLGKSALCSFWAVDDKEASKLKSIFRRRWRCA